MRYQLFCIVYQSPAPFSSLPSQNQHARAHQLFEGRVYPKLRPHHLSSDGDLDLDTGIDVDNDLLDNLGGGSKAARRLV